MNADLEHLIVLQAQDLELRRLRQQLTDAPLRVAAAQTARAKAEVALTSARASLAKEETLRRSQQLDVAAAHSRIARLRRQMESATSAAQITALEHEITFAQHTIAKLEDDELASMERTEQLDTALASASAALASTTSTLAAERARAAAVDTHNRSSILAIETERAELRPRIAEQLLSNYDRLAKAKGTGLSEALDHKCSACQMVVRPQRWNDLTDRDPAGPFANTIFHCETCGRMLFYDPRRDAPVRWSPGDRLSSATATLPRAAAATPPHD